MSNMNNPPHPGHVLREWIPESMSVREAAKDLKISPVRLSKILNANSKISAEIAIRLSLWLGTAPELWLTMQVKHDLWKAEKFAKLDIKRLGT